MSDSVLREPTPEEYKELAHEFISRYHNLKSERDRALKHAERLALLAELVFDHLETGNPPILHGAGIKDVLEDFRAEFPKGE